MSSVAVIKLAMGWQPLNRRQACVNCDLVDYWLMGMDTLTSKDDLRRPLTSHNLLRAVVASYSDAALASAEKERLTGGRGETPPRSAGVPPASTPKAGEDACTTGRPAPHQPRAAMPAHIRDTLRNFAFSDQLKTQEPSNGQA